VRHNAAELLARRGYRPGAVAAARRFYRGELDPGEFYRTLLQFAGAYNYRNNLLVMARELLFGSRLQAQPEELIFGYSRLLPGWSVMERLAEVHMPVLVLAGRHDFLFPPEHQAILADRLPDARLEIIERAGHSPHAERPAETLAAIQRFLALTAQNPTPVRFATTANAE
jgi:proline iminopeptidase